MQHIDIAPTIFDAVGVTPNWPIDGVSWLRPGERDRLHLEYFYSLDNTSIRTWYGTVTKTYEYVEFYQKSTTDKTLWFREYYDLDNDPYQLVNLLHDGTKADDPPLAPLHRQLTKDRTCVGSACP